MSTDLIPVHFPSKTVIQIQESSPTLPLPHPHQKSVPVSLHFPSYFTTSSITRTSIISQHPMPLTSFTIKRIYQFHTPDGVWKETQPAPETETTIATSSTFAQHCELSISWCRWHIVDIFNFTQKFGSWMWLAIANGNDCYSRFQN